MKAIHVNWTKPYFERQRLRGHGFEVMKNSTSNTYDLTDFQILYTMASIIEWKYHMEQEDGRPGPIKLHTDTVGANYYQSLGILDLYDEVDVNFLNGYSKSNIDAAYFWTSGKIKCLAHQNEPFVFLDQDMIINEPLPDYTYENDLTIAHWEIGRGYYYFDKEKWDKEIKHIEWPKNYDENDWSPNTSFLQFNNIKILREYHEWHKKLVTTNGEDIPEWFWLFTDQGILGHIIRENDYKINTLTNKIALSHHNTTLDDERYKGKAEKWYLPENPDLDKETSFDHVWLDKIGYNQDSKKYDVLKNHWFQLIVGRGYSSFLHNERFKKYWDEFNKNN